MKKLEVVAGIIIYNDLILCMQRNKGKYEYISYKYEFPGGKIEPGETKKEALMRELQEEMGLDVEVDEKDFFMTVDHVYPDFEVTMHSFICKVNSRAFDRREHVDHKWLKREELMDLDWVAADLPIVCKLQE